MGRRNYPPPRRFPEFFDAIVELQELSAVAIPK